MRPVAPGQGMANVALIAGILTWTCCPVVGALAALLFAGLARAEALEHGQRTPGSATAGAILALVQLIPAALLAMFLAVAAIVGSLSGPR